MKTLITLIIFLLSFNTYSQIKSIKLLQINSEWNLKNDIQRSELPNRYLAHKIAIEHATLEDQTPSFQKSFGGRPLPILILKINDKMEYQWSANLSFKLQVSKEEILEVIHSVLKLK
tara:strand:- start:20 stop:370 length:351 start_codon:yes stop_codon:yes gene_type:complete